MTPLLAGGLERSFELAEALEARGFGARAGPSAWSWRGSVLTAGSLAAIVTGAYLLLIGQSLPALLFILAGGLGVLLGARLHRSGDALLQRTRYREPVWGRLEWIVSLASGLVLVIEIAILALDPAAFAFDPYPILTPPTVNLLLLAALGLLLAPAAIAP